MGMDRVSKDFTGVLRSRLALVDQVKGSLQGTPPFPLLFTIHHILVFPLIFMFIFTSSFYYSEAMTNLSNLDTNGQFSVSELSMNVTSGFDDLVKNVIRFPKPIWYILCVIMVICVS